MGNPAKKLKRFITVLGITGVVYGVFRFLLPLVVPFFIAWGLAVFLWPSALWIAEHMPYVYIDSAQSIRNVRIGCGRTGDGADRKCHGRIIFRIPIGIIGIAECLFVLAIFIAGFYFFSWKACVELFALRSQIPDWAGAVDRSLTSWCHCVEECFRLKNDCLVLMVREMLRGVLDTVKRSAMPYVMVNSVTVFRWCASFFIFVALTLVAVGMLLQELPQWRIRLKKSLFREELRIICGDFLLAANAYLRTQGILLVLISVICMAVFWLMGNPYYLLAGLGTGILDALPIFGTGTVLIPWAIILFFRRRVGRGAVLLILYIACYFLRQLLEARLMSRKLGLSPFTELMALFVGIRLFGLMGLFLGPVGCLLIRDLTEWICTANFKNSTQEEKNMI